MNFTCFRKLFGLLYDSRELNLLLSVQNLIAIDIFTENYTFPRNINTGHFRVKKIFSPKIKLLMTSVTSVMKCSRYQISFDIIGGEIFVVYMHIYHKFRINKILIKQTKSRIAHSLIITQVSPYNDVEERISTCNLFPCIPRTNLWCY